MQLEYKHIEENTLQRLQPFTSIEGMNVAVKEHKKIQGLSGRDKVILDVISRFACVYVGVCYLNKQRIAEEAGYVSRRTAIRACKRLEELGVIKQYETRRIKGDKRQSVNIIVIQPVVLATTSELQKENLPPQNLDQASEVHRAMSQQEVTAASHTKEASLKTPLKINTSLETEKRMKRGLKTAIPEAIFNAFSPYFDAKTLYEIYGVLLRAKRNAPFMMEDYAERYIDHFYNVIRLYEWGRVRNLKSYLYVTWERLTSEISRQRKSDGPWNQLFQGTFTYE